MRRAHADVVWLRSDLAKPGEKAKVRQQLIAKLQEIGHVESIERFVAEPKDGPFRDGTFGAFDWDRFTLIRVIGYVTPHNRIDLAGGLVPQ